jgi:hypothetical protein
MQDSSNTPVDNMTNLSQNQSSSEEAVLESFQHVNEATEPTNQSNTQKPLHTGINMKSKKTNVLIVLSIVAILAGVGTGYGGFKLQTKATGEGTNVGGGSGEIQQVATEGSVAAGDVFGINDKETFKDNTEGYLEIGGLDGEGSHKLLRPGGPSQTVYLTSSITDLDQFDGMEVKIAGETFKGQKAGWLMDVGRVEVVKVKGTAPSEN